MPEEDSSASTTVEDEESSAEFDDAVEIQDAAERPHWVVGVGASAGGLEALQELLRHVPLESMAFVVVQHLSPQHESVLTEILARSSTVEVVTAADDMRLSPNRVYVIPPNADLAVMHGVLHLISPAQALRPRLPIDYFFRSLAADRGSSAVGIVLSGTGSDGTFGLEAIKAAGGVTFAQEPSSAKYDSMPQSALDAGCADFCLSPREIGEELTRLSKTPPVALPPRRSKSLGPHDQLAKLFVLIRAEFGNDLTHYKPSTVKRRIERRMMLHKLARFDDYLKYVQTNGDELRALYKDMLISVTRFFRDHDAFEVLVERVLPQILDRKQKHAAVRVWVPACATGEEAYSIAICALEAIEARSQDAKVQIFATDIDEDSVRQARRGVYPRNIVLDVSPERLERFFVKMDDGYHVNRRVRDSVVFSKHNLLNDAPFSRIDLVSCRNLLIYLEPPAQKSVLRILHYALNASPPGFLLLGSSETVGDLPSLFSLVEHKAKIYVKKAMASVAGLNLRFGVPSDAREPHPTPRAGHLQGLQSVADRKVLDLYGPPGVVVDEQLQVLQFRGRTGAYLDPAPGSATLDLLRIARFELHMDLKNAVQRARTEQARVTSDIVFHVAGEARALRIDVMPLAGNEANARCFLVLFQELPAPKELPALETDAADAARVRELERELAVTKDYLQTTLEDNESTTEALKATNEELQSANEELQSTNEELETSKEEMQSTNEELTTVNEELQNRMSELGQTNDDLLNLLSGVDSAVVIASLDLRVRRYTTAAAKLFSLVPTDVGRSIDFLDVLLGRADLVTKAQRVIESLGSIEEERLGTTTRWFALRIAPYRTLDHSIRGVVITVTDIDVRKRATDLMRDVGKYAAEFLAALDQPLLIIEGKNRRVVWANDPFYAAFQVTPEETVGAALGSLGTRQWADPALQRRIDEALATGTVFRDVRVRHRFPEIGDRVMRVNGNQIPVVNESVLLLLTIREERDDEARGRP